MGYRQDLPWRQTYARCRSAILVWEGDRLAALFGSLGRTADRSPWALDRVAAACAVDGTVVDLIDP